MSSALLLTLPLVAAADEFGRGLTAYEAGDFAEALRIWTPLAEGDLAEAQFNLGLIYEHGKGVGPDPSAALGWYRRAADQDYARAQYATARLYEEGAALPTGRPDLVRAHLWFALAAESRFSDARKRKKRVAKRMDPFQIAEAERLFRDRRRQRKALASR